MSELKSKKVGSILDKIETEMKKIGYWSDNPPDFSIENFTQAPTFELWLQCTFIPNARKAAEKNEYPEKSEVGLMGMRQYNYHSFIPEAQGLLLLLYEFDKIIEDRD